MNMYKLYLKGLMIIYLFLGVIINFALMSVLQTVCLIGVVEKYKELAKYNLRQLTSSKP